MLGASGAIGAAVCVELEQCSTGHNRKDLMPWRMNRPGGLWPDTPIGLVCAFGDYGPHGSFSAANLDEWSESFGLNFFAQIAEVQKFMYMLGNRPGRVVLMSGAGIGSPKHPPLRSAYTVCKAAIAHFVEAVAPEMPNIAINAVAPGSVKSKMNPDGEGTPDAAAKMIGWLMSAPEAQQITGRLLSAKWDELPIDPELLQEHDYRLRRFVA